MRNAFRAVRVFLVTVSLAVAQSSSAHPGAALAVATDGRVFFVDTGAGIFAIEPSGRVVRQDGPAFHWFALDLENGKRRWPGNVAAAFRSIGQHPSLVISSDCPVTIGPTGTFYYPEAGPDGLVRVIGIGASGSRSTVATLPRIRSSGKPATWLNGLASGPDGSLYYTEDATVRKIDSQGHVTTILRDAQLSGCAAIPGVQSTERPYFRGLAVSRNGSVYVAASGCGQVIRVGPDGRISTVIRSTSPWSPTAVAVANDDVFVLEYLHTASDDRREWLPRVRKMSRSGAVSVLFSGTRH